MEHTRVYFLLFNNHRFLEVLHGHDKPLNFLVDVSGFSGENLLEVIVGSLVDLLSVLRGLNLLGEDDAVLSDQVFDLVRGLHRNVEVRPLDALEV